MRHTFESLERNAADAADAADVAARSEQSRREHKHISHALIEEGTAVIDVHSAFRHGLGHLALVDAETLLKCFRVGNAPLPLPVPVLLHVFRVVAEVEDLI